MAKKIIVAGAGHGGITCGALLAKNGYDVTVYERNTEDNMGHDWTDIFDPKAFKAVGMDMLKLRKDQGFSADFSGAICLFVSTLFGLPVSTTHTKTSSVLGVGVAKSFKSVNWSVAGEMVLAWILTFPGCGLLGWAICYLFLKIF